MGGKSRRTGGVSEALIKKLKKEKERRGLPLEKKENVTKAKERSEDGLF